MGRSETSFTDAVLDQDGDAVLQLVLARIEEATAAEEVGRHVWPHCCITPPKWRQCRLLDERAAVKPLEDGGLVARQSRYRLVLP